MYLFSLYLCVCILGSKKEKPLICSNKQNDSQLRTDLRKSKKKKNKKIEDIFLHTYVVNDDDERHY